MQMFVAWFFFNAHWARVTSNLSDSVAADVAVATQLFREDPTDETAKKLDALATRYGIVGGFAAW